MCNSKKNQSGFTLVEMAISLIIVGILLSSASYIYSLYLIKKESTETLRAVSTVTSALYAYKNANGRYPCPAPILERKDTSANYGHETKCEDPAIETGTVVPPGACLTGANPPKNYNGICVESSTRTISGVNPRVRVGSIPFRDLQIDEKDTIDGYGSRLVYAVTENMAVAATYKDTIAGIEIRDGAGNILSGGAQSVAFVVISPGKNKNGAVSIDGQPRPCLTTTTDLDGQNCRDFTGVGNTQAIYTMDAQASGTNQFDDIVEYFVPTNAEVWRREKITSENIVDMSEDKVGIGITSPTELTDELTVKQSTINNDPSMVNRKALSATNTTGGNYQSGGLRVGQFVGGLHKGKILANSYCTEDGSKCFTTDKIAGTYDDDPVNGTSGLGCDTSSGNYMVGIEKGHAKCKPVRFACPAGQVLKGTNTDGTPLCSLPIPGCAAEPQPICGANVMLEPRANTFGQHIFYDVGDVCAYAYYRCNAGKWERDGSASYDWPAACNFTNATATKASTTVACDSGYSGTYTQETIMQCNGWPKNTTNNKDTACTCVGKTDNVVCSGDFDNAVVGTKQQVCTNNTLDGSYSVFKDNDGISYPTEGALLGAKCNCTKATTWELSQCGTGQVRNPSPNPASFTDPSANWPADTSYGVYRLRTINKATCTYDSVANNSSNCVCSSGYNYRDVDPVCDSCDKVDTKGKIRQIRSGSGCDWVDDPDKSANTTGTCKPKTFLWKSTGSPAAKSNPLNDGHGSTLKCDSECLCSKIGSPGTCAVSNGSQWDYQKSVCQTN